MQSFISLHHGLQTAVLISILSQAVISYPSQNAFAACNAINATGGIEIQALPQGLVEYDYLYTQSHYWSAANADLYPACVVFPESAQSVSDIMYVLLNYTDVNFAVKSGGHNPNVGFSNVDGGVLISMSKLASTTLSDDKETADVGPGARWNEALAAMIPHGKAVVGGRLGEYENF
jgi:FAD/FMN-containing dehydrogenase